MSQDLALLCIQRQIEALSFLPAVVQSSEYKKIVELITNITTAEQKHNVFMAGVGKNANIASKISQTLSSLGVPSAALNVTHLAHGDFGMIRPGDVIIHISRSGTTKEMLDAIDHIRFIFPDVIQVLIHCKQGKPINPALDSELFIGAVKEGDEHELAPTTSTTALLCILDCISVQVSANIGFSRHDFLRFHPGGALGELLKAEQKALDSLTLDEPLIAENLNDSAHLSGEL
jgi:D-arabinose 5-phosphate isomerase GutQ